MGTDAAVVERAPYGVGRHRPSWKRYREFRGLIASEKRPSSPRKRGSILRLIKTLGFPLARE